MRFHIGYSFKLKTLLKWIIPIFVGLGAFFGIANIEVLALENPSNCSDSSITDYMTCNIQGYYSITDDDITNACNLYLGDSSTLNWRTRQVAVQIDYDVKASEISTTYDSNLLSMQQISRENNGQKQNNFAFRFLRDENDSPLYLSLTTYNMTSDTCQTIHGAITCPPPAITVYYCNSDTFNSCYNESWGYAQSFSNELIGDIRFTTYKNLPLKTNAQIKQQYNRSEDFNYIQINFPNMPNSDTLSPPPINSGWNYSGVLLSSHALTSDESPTDNKYITKYCKDTGGDFVQTGGGGVTDEVTQAIHDTLTGPNGVLTDNTPPNINLDFFNDLEWNSGSLTSLMMFPIDLLTTIINNQDTCTPFSLDLSSITRKWGGNDYVLTLPCIRTKMQSLLGNWYEVFDLLIAGILFYYFASNLVLKINDLLSGVDAMPYFYTSSSRGRTSRVGTYDKNTGEVIN